MTVTLAEEVTVEAPSTSTTDGASGTPGRTAAVNVFDAAEAAELPPAFIATDVKVYAVLSSKPDTTHEPEESLTLQVFPPGCAVTV
ncbi:MAG TPA: hypothetical protein VGH11_06590 [Jatrophihabitans sp.]